MQNPYLKSKVLTADRGQILLMLYDGAIRYGRQAVLAYERQKPLEALPHMGRMLNIVQELQTALDHKQDPELCANLESLYVFVQDRLLAAQQHKDAAPLHEAEAILADLRDTWRAALEQQQQEAFPISRTG